MKKYFYNLLMTFISVSAFTLFSCGGNDDEEEDVPAGTPKVQSVVGVWENGNYFISLSDDKFLTAYIGDNFIDNGTYIVSPDNKKITCSNTYYNHITNYDITSISDKQLNLDISYTDVFGKDHKKSLNLTKSTKIPVSKDNGLVGKSYRYLTGNFGHVTYTFSSYNIGSKSSEKTGMAKYPLIIHYIYFNGNIYYQEFTSSSSQVPTIGGWTTGVNAGEIIAAQVYFDSAGGIYNIRNVSDTAL